MPSRNTSSNRNGGIDKLDFDSRRRAPSSTLDESDRSSPNGLLRDDESFFEDIVDGMIERDRRKMRRLVIKYVSFASSILSWCICPILCCHCYLFLTWFAYIASAPVL